MRQCFAVHLICFLLAFCGLFLDPVYGQQQGDYVSGEVIVKFRPDVVILPAGRSEATIQEVTVTDTAVAALNQRVGVTYIKKVLPNWKSADTLATDRYGRPVTLIDFSWVYKILVPQTSDIRAIVEQYRRLAAVVYAEPNGIWKLQVTPNDPRFGEQWGLHHTSPDTFDIDAPEAWDIYPYGGSWDSVIVAVLDSGLDYNHNDFGRDWLGPYPNQKVIQGHDYVNNDTDPMDDDDVSHGTHVTGVLGALTNFTTPYGIAGIAGGWNSTDPPGMNLLGCRIMPVKVLNSIGKGEWTNIANGIDYARTNGAHVINLSLGDYDRSQTVHDALWNAYVQGIVTVAAMGNQNTQAVLYPAGWSEFIIAVGAIDSTGNKASFSNFGNQIDVTGPGVSVLSTIRTINNPPWGRLNGTSMATPHVSGVAALIRSVGSQGGDGVDIEEIVERSAQDLTNPPGGSGYDIYFGHGLAKARAAIDTIRLNTLVRGSSGSSPYSSTGSYQVTFYTLHHPHYDPSLSDLGTGNYYVERYERRATVTFPRTFTTLPHVWARANGTKGWPYLAPGSSTVYYINDNYAEVVPGTLTTTGCTLRTYVYKVWNSIGQFVGWYPTTEANVTFAYSALGRVAATKVAVAGSTTNGDQVFSLKNYPNPFNPSTTISYTLPEASTVRLTIYNILGQQVRTLINNRQAAGIHAVQWDGHDDAGRSVASGLYFYRLTAGEFTQTQKMLLLK